MSPTNCVVINPAIVWIPGSLIGNSLRCAVLFISAGHEAPAISVRAASIGNEDVSILLHNVMHIGNNGVNSQTITVDIKSNVIPIWGRLSGSISITRVAQFDQHGGIHGVRQFNDLSRSNP